MNILKRVENSILWLLNFPAAAEANLRKEAAKHGVLTDQIIFTDVAPKDEHLARGFRADLFLDTNPCNGHTTTADILWAGTPVVTMTEQRMASRVAASLLHAVGLPELAVSSLEEYEELAVALALDPDRLFGMRRHIEQCRDSCAAFDTARWVRNFEMGLDKAWHRFEKKEEPDHIEVHDAEPVYVLKQPSLL
jgi:protein O-GlcNAc transferase